MFPSAQAMDNRHHLLFLNYVTTLCLIEHSTLKSNWVPILHEYHVNGIVQDICVYLKWLYVVRQMQYWLFYNIFFSIFQRLVDICLSNSKIGFSSNVYQWSCLCWVTLDESLIVVNKS